MLFTSLAFVGLAALATAAPRPDVPISERGLTWEPRGLEERGRGSRNNNNNNDDITIVDTTFIQIDESTRGREQELIVFIKEKTIIRDNSNKFKDNIRRNHYRSKNRNVNTVVIIVTQVIDIRDSNNRNTRYMQRQIRANNNNNRGGNNDVIIMVTEVVAITIDSNSNNNNNNNGRGGRGGSVGGPTGVGKANLATGVSAAVPIMTIAANAPYSPSNLTMVLPSGAPPPSLSGVSQELDPARIIEENQLLFVSEAS